MPKITDEERARFHKYLDASIDKMNSPKNCKKPHWSDQSVSDLLYHLENEVCELFTAVRLGRPEHQIYESNDVINLAMMIIDNNHGKTDA